MKKQLKFIECPRDAMQGWPKFISTENKVAYLNSLLQVGFDTIDFGSFVSEKMIPQMADTKKVIPQLRLEDSISKLLAIVANVRGATEAAAFDEIFYLGFPFSVSEIFQKKNTNSSISEALKTVEVIQKICLKQKKKLVVYLSMGFGNPYGEKFDKELVVDWVRKIQQLDVEIISLADTVGIATPILVNQITSCIIQEFSKIEIGVHLHANPTSWQDKFSAALSAGCFRFDGALKGLGGCPMADNKLVGNMNTELMLAYCEKNTLSVKINKSALANSLQIAGSIFN